MENKYVEVDLSDTDRDRDNEACLESQESGDNLARIFKMGSIDLNLRKIISVFGIPYS